jgi:hypothetical protein
MSTKQTILTALETYRGDDLYRARSAFRHCTHEELNSEYGQSGKTRAEIIAEYEAREAKINAAIADVERFIK